MAAKTEDAAVNKALHDAMERKRVASEAVRAAEEKAKRLRAKSDKLNPPNPVDPEEQD